MRIIIVLLTLSSGYANADSLSTYERFKQRCLEPGGLIESIVEAFSLQKLSRAEVSERGIFCSPAIWMAKVAQDEHAIYISNQLSDTDYRQRLQVRLSNYLLPENFSGVRNRSHTLAVSSDKETQIQNSDSIETAVGFKSVSGVD